MRKSILRRFCGSEWNVRVAQIDFYAAIKIYENRGKIMSHSHYEPHINVLIVVNNTLLIHSIIKA